MRQQHGDISVARFTCNPFAENTYVVSVEQDAWLVDPGTQTQAECQAVDDYLNEYDLTVRALMLTHAHIDHVLGLTYWAERTGLQPMLHANEYVVYQAQALVAHEYGLVLPTLPQTVTLWGQSEEDLGSLSLGPYHWQGLWLPGHSPGHVCWYQPDQKILLSGDLLFQNGIGRTDLPLGDQRAMQQSLRRVFQLPGDVQVYPGHGLATTVGCERVHYPMLCD